ncbi:MAG: GNAT family N-acetyltransferase [Allosphingosinicella sp.]|uniref:GNAT family N-acetyltransferase n=1 Tax=Allosphingosinicella sp. TaxID=2823234 RepID=UPI003938A4F1
MFARTDRLLLRPGWAEDAPALARAIADETIVRNLASAPWPYRLADAEAFVAERPVDPVNSSLLILRRTARAPELVGVIGLARMANGEVDLGYWIARAHWGRGYATEAGSAVIAMARDGLRLERLTAGHFLDNPASGRVLEKLGFRATGEVVRRYSVGRKAAAPCRMFVRDLSDGLACREPLCPAMAA